MSVAFEQNRTDVQVLNLVGVWVEALLYGIYFFLFSVALHVLVQRNTLEGRPSKVFLTGIILMFVLISVHICLSMYRMTIAFAYQAQDPVWYLYDMTNWRNLSGIAVEIFIVWIGDILVIYRCFLVWKRSYWAVSLPIILFLLSAATHLMAIRLVGQQADAVRLAVHMGPFLLMSLPLCLAQNVLTTGLIIWKLWVQFRETEAIGLTSLHTIPIPAVIRIIVESAALYTTELFVFMILQLVNHPGRFLLHYLLVPSTGITFVLLTIRAHVLREEAQETPASPSLMPSFLFDKATSQLQPHRFS